MGEIHPKKPWAPVLQDFRKFVGDVIEYKISNMLLNFLC